MFTSFSQHLLYGFFPETLSSMSPAPALFTHSDPCPQYPEGCPAGPPSLVVDSQGQTEKKIYQTIHFLLFINIGMC